MCEGFGGLVGKAVDEVDVDAVKAEVAGGLDESASEFEGLNAIDRFLNERMEVLDAHAEAVETHLAKSFEMFAARNAGIDFDADLRVGSESEVFAGEAEEIFDLRGSEIRGCTAAPVKLHDRAITGNAVADASHFAFQDFEVRWRDAFIFLDDDVAGAEEAQAFAKRNVHVERDGRFSALGFFVDFFEVGGAEGIVPDRRGGIAGVAGAGAIVACEELFAGVKLLAHALQAWIRDRHGKDPLTPICCGFSLLQQRLLASFDEDLSIFNRSVLKDTVAKIQDVADSAKRRHGFLGHAANFLRRTEKHGRVDISLQGDAGNELIAKLAHIHAPVHAQYICT